MRSGSHPDLETCDIILATRVRSLGRQPRSVDAGLYRSRSASPDVIYVRCFALALRARVLAECARRIWRLVKLLLGLARLMALRVDLRDGRPFESSRATDDRLDP